MRIELAGSLRVAGPTGSLESTALGGRRNRVVLTALALSGEGLTAERLADLVWQDSPPPTWSDALRGAVGDLRRRLDAVGLGGQRLVVTMPGGYRIAAGLSVDLDEARATLRTATAHAQDERHHEVVETVEPLTRWRGADLAPGEADPWWTAHRELVDSVARTALGLFVSAASRAGDHDRAADAARRWIAVDRHDERAHRALIETLAAAGDRAGVVAAFEACRSSLADELGVDPSPETVRVYLAGIGDQLARLTAPVPRAETGFYGRERERELLSALVEEPGLVTCSGVGGVGKSRLVAESVHGLALEGGVSWVSLEPVGLDELVAATTALTLNVTPGDDPIPALVEQLAPRGRTLLVLDGCDAAVDGAASLAAELCGACPRLTVVVTSRRPLDLAGEQVVRLEPWPVPDEREAVDIGEHPIARLLVDRVTRQGGRLERAEVSGPDLRGVLRRCAGLPLAVELVAAQLAQAGVDDVAGQLDLVRAEGDDPLRLVARGAHALLTDEEQRVFRRLAVLDGPVDLPLVRAVVSDDDVRQLRVLRLLHQLVSSGLVRVERTPARWTWSLDDELRAFARELLHTSGEERTTLGRLAEVVLEALGDDARAAPGQYAAWVDAHVASVRALLASGVDGRSQADVCLEIAFRLHRYWASSNIGEGRFWLRLLLSSTVEGPWTAYATFALGYLDYWAGDSGAIPLLRSAAAQLEGRDDPYAARALVFLAGLLDDTDEADEAIEVIRRAVVLAEPHGVALQMPTVMGIGSVLSERGDVEAADWAARAIDLLRRDGSPEQLTIALPTAAMICWQVGRYDDAWRYVAEAAPLHETEPRISRVVLWSVTAGLHLAEGDVATGLDLATRADAEGVELGVDRELPLVRAVLARLRLATGDRSGARAAARACLEAASDLTFDAPLALALETAAVVLEADGVAPPAELRAAASALRRRGSRPAPVTLRLSPIGGGDDVSSGDLPNPRTAAALARSVLDGGPAETM